MHAADKPDVPSAGAAGADQTPPPRTIQSADLLAGRNELWIDHHGVIYRLRVTRMGKLILQK